MGGTGSFSVRDGARRYAGLMTNWERIGVFDLETTGLDVTRERVVTAFVGVLDANGDVIESNSWVANPGVPIPDRAAEVHGYTTERVQAEGRPAADVVSEVLEALRGLFAQGIPVVAYNATYDFSLLHFDALRNGLAPLDEPQPIFDPLIIDKKVDTYRKGSRTLIAACDTYGVTLDDAHEARSDAVAAGRVLLAIARKYPDDAHLQGTPHELHANIARWAREQAESYADWAARNGRNASRPGPGSWPVYEA